MRAFWWTAGDDGCAWYRCHLPAAALSLRGHETHADSRFDPGRWDDADVYIGQRVCNEGPTQRWRRWAAEGRRLAFDVDDHYFAFDDTNSDAYAFYSRPEVRGRLADNMAAATVVTCATPRLADELSRYNPNVVVVPNGLPAALLDWPSPEPAARVTVGWAGSVSTAPELPLAAAALRDLLDRPPPRVPVGLHTIGVDQRTIADAGLGHVCTRVTPWVPHSMAYLKTVDFDIWVAPYRPTRFNEAKVPTKALEAAFLGVPIVASDIEPYRTFVRHGETGLLVRKPGDWSTHLRALASDADLRARMGKAAREQALEHTIDAIAPLWERALSPAGAA